VLVVASNQSGVARGYFTEESVERVNEALSGMLEAEGVKVERFYFCPHHPQGAVPEYARACECRKPKSGLLVAAARDADIDLKASYSVGDSARDLEAGRAAGTKTVLVLTGYGRQADGEVKERRLADHVAKDLAAAARWIIADAAGGGCKTVNG
jgi:D-glycero-D-manno-heptose 1,7-bisphosphate phosphatase